MANNASPQSVQESSGIAPALPAPVRHRLGRSSLRASRVALIGFACLLWLINWLPIQAPTYVFLGNAVATQSRWNQLVLLSRTRVIDSEKIHWLDCAPAADARLGSPSTDLKVLKIRVGLQRAADSAFVEREIERLTRPTSNLDATAPLRQSLREQRWRAEVVNHQLHRFQLDCEREGIAMSDFTAASSFRLASHPKRVVSSNTLSQERETDNSVSGSERRKITDDDRATWHQLTELKTIHDGNIKRLESELEHLVAVSAGHFALTGAPKVSALPGKFSWMRSILGLTLATSLAVGITFGLPRTLRRGAHWLSKLPKRPTSKSGRVRTASHDPMDRNREITASKASECMDESEVARTLERFSIAYWGRLSYRFSEQGVLQSKIVPPTTTIDHSPHVEGENKAQWMVLDADSRETRWRWKPSTRTNRFNQYSWFVFDGATIGDTLLVAWLCIFVLRYGVDSVWRELLFKAPLAAFSSVLFGI